MGITIVNKYDFERDVFFSKFLLLNLGIFGVVRWQSCRSSFYLYVGERSPSESIRSTVWRGEPEVQQYPDLRI